jgi:hypothetical protein
MHWYSISPATKVKGDKVGHFNVQGTIQTDQIMSVPYASAVRSNMCFQV